MERIVICDDAIKWLEQEKFKSYAGLNSTPFSTIVSLPDYSEFSSYTLERWKNWFIETARLVLNQTPDDGVTIFYQSDIKHEGTWVDKGYLCQKAAELEEKNLLWHKVICRVPPGMATFGRPAYSHILCFSKNVKANLERATADVIPVIGDKIWARGMGLEAALMMAQFVAKETPSTWILNPFCGEGSMLAAANWAKLSILGIERSPKRAEKAGLIRIVQNEEKKKKFIIS